MVIKVSRSYKNESLIGICCAIIEDSKLEKHSYLVQYSWQVQCLDTLRYPKTIGQDIYPLAV